MVEEDFFDLSPEETFDSFDALGETGEDPDAVYDLDAPAESGIIRVDPAEFPDMEQLAQRSEEINAMPACMRIEVLFDNMSSCRKLLLAILGKCMVPCSNDELVEFITEWQKTDVSIFTPDGILHHLHRAGALARQTEDSTDFETLDLSPKTVIIDGVEYLEASETPTIFWATTPDGADVVTRNRPAEALRRLLDEEPQYAHIYRTVLATAGNEAGTTEKFLGMALNNDPALQRPRMYAARFLDRLSYHEAIRWNGTAWVITEIGTQALAYLNGEVH